MTRTEATYLYWMLDRYLGDMEKSFADFENNAGEGEGVAYGFRSYDITYRVGKSILKRIENEAGLSKDEIGKEEPPGFLNSVALFQAKAVQRKTK